VRTNCPLTVWLISCGIGLCGCMQSGPSPEALANLNQAREACKAQYEKFVPRVKCSNDAINKYLRPTTTYPDLLDLYEAERVALAEKVDNVNPYGG
jgi:hypothetical protein